MQVTGIRIVAGALEILPKGLEKELEGFEIGGRIETILYTPFLRSARILKIVLVTREKVPSFRLQ